jgi:uncharacterized oligopeptide transporter (OPT) family protein
MPPPIQTCAKRRSEDAATSGHETYVPDDARISEFTWPAVVVGAVLGIIFWASSLYLVLKVGMTVSASIPVAVLSITLFRAFSRMFGLRPATILENNIVQTTGSAGESIAFGVGVTMPALMLLGFDMSIWRVMVVSILGGLLGILMMIPLRRAYIVRMHDELRYPEGTACAQVLISGEQGGATGRLVFIGFILAFIYKYLTLAADVLRETIVFSLKEQYNRVAALTTDLAPELLGGGLHHRDENGVRDDGRGGDRQFGDDAGHRDVWRRHAGVDSARNPAHRADGHRRYSIQLFALHRRGLRHGGGHH